MCDRCEITNIVAKTVVEVVTRISEDRPEVCPSIAVNACMLAAVIIGRANLIDGKPETSKGLDESMVKVLVGFQDMVKVVSLADAFKVLKSTDLH